MNIQVNQAGYLPNDVKQATFRAADTKAVSDAANAGGISDEKFRVVNSTWEAVIYEGTLSDAVKSELNGEVNKVADFSEITTPGRYAVESDNCGRSYEFVIGNDVYDEVLSETLKMFYMHRCGCELPESTAGRYAHRACHNTPARIYGTDKFIDVTGGWHDAGDYGRYIVAAAKTVVDLMMAYEYYPEAMSVPYISGQNNGAAPDILDEIKYELDWMLKMQDETSGGVYHKATCASFPGFVMPEDETEELVVCPISDAATGDFVAAMAYAYRFYSKAGRDVTDAGKAAEYTKAADIYMASANKAFKFLETESTGPFHNPDGVVTGEYDDENPVDEYFWAYAEMYKTTGDKKYEELIKGMKLDEVPGDFGWKEVGDYGFYAYITAPYEKDEALYNECMRRLTEKADEKLANYEKDPYGASIYGYFYWGCNMEIADNARRGILIDKINGTDKYKKMISSQLHYLLGNNPNSKCYLTGFGSDSPKNPHHRPSGAKNKAMPGMLVGGPEPLLLDEVAVKLLPGMPPAKCYLDLTQSYSTNEITIYWNSPLVFLLAYMISEIK